MYGYVRPLTGELKVREQQMYRAIYCGLCHSMGNHTGQISRLALSYDLVFLCAFRAAAERVPLTVRKQACILHPLHRRPTVRENPVLAYGAAISALLADGKIRDDLADERGLRRACAAAALPFTSAAYHRVKDTREFGERVQAHLRRLSELEKNGCDSPDETSLCFGAVLEDIFADGLSGTEERIARTVGRATGQFIYLIDAADDAEKDMKKSRYNPILRCYGNDILVPCDPARAAAVEDGTRHTRKGLVLKEEIAEQILIAVCTDLKGAAAAAELLDYSGTAPEAEGIVKNILYLGMPAVARRILHLPVHIGATTE